MTWGQTIAFAALMTLAVGGAIYTVLRLVCS